MTSAETIATRRILGKLPAKRKAPAAQMYRIRKAFAVVYFEPAGQGRIVFLPEGAELRIIGPSCLYKCFEVLYENRLYNMFKADLLGPWANPVPNLIRPTTERGASCA